MAFDRGGDHSFADIICLCDLSFPSLMQEHANSMLVSESHQRQCIFDQIPGPKSIFLCSPTFRLGELRPTCILRVL